MFINNQVINSRIEECSLLTSPGCIRTKEVWAQVQDSSCFRPHLNREIIILQTHNFAIFCVECKVLLHVLRTKQILYYRDVWGIPRFSVVSDGFSRSLNNFILQYEHRYWKTIEWALKHIFVQLNNVKKSFCDRPCNKQ